MRTTFRPIHSLGTLATLGIVLSITSFAHSETPVTTGLTALYQFENVGNLGANSVNPPFHDASDSTAVVQGGGVFGNGGNFGIDPTDARITANSSDIGAISPGASGAVTVGFWESTIDAGRQSLVSLYSDSTVPSGLYSSNDFVNLGIASDPTHILVEYGTGYSGGGSTDHSYSPMLSGGVNLADGNWHYVTMTATVSGGSLTLSEYVDGVPENASSFSTNGMVFNNLRIGRQLDDALSGGQFNFAGNLDDFAAWGRGLDARSIAAVAGLGAFSSASLTQASQIDSVLALNSIGQSAVVNGMSWSYTQTFAAPVDGASLTAGMHYVGVDGKDYIVLDDLGNGSFAGVVNAVPEPSSSALLTLGTFVAVLSARRCRTREPRSSR